MTKPTDRGSELCNLSNMHIISAKEERNFSSSRTLKMLILLLFSLSKFKSAPCTSFGGKAQQLKSDVFLPYTWRLPTKQEPERGCRLQRATRYLDGSTRSSLLSPHPHLLLCRSSSPQCPILPQRHSKCVRVRLRQSEARMRISTPRQEDLDKRAGKTQLTTGCPPLSYTDGTFSLVKWYEFDSWPSVHPVSTR